MSKSAQHAILDPWEQYAKLQAIPGFQGFSFEAHQVKLHKLADENGSDNLGNVVIVTPIAMYHAIRYCAGMERYVSPKLRDDPTMSLAFWNPHQQQSDGKGVILTGVMPYRVGWCPQIGNVVQLDGIQTILAIVCGAHWGGGKPAQAATFVTSGEWRDPRKRAGQNCVGPIVVGIDESGTIQIRQHTEADGWEPMALYGIMHKM